MFNVGDKVTCVNNNLREKVLTIEKVYVVVGVGEDMIKIRNDQGDKLSYYFNRFELLNEIKVKEEIW